MADLPSDAGPQPDAGPPPNAVWRHVRRVVTFVIGSTVVLIGIAMLVLPGPAFIVIPAGLAILAIEFVWARRLLRRMRNQVNRAVGRPVDADPLEESDTCQKPDESP
jgi:uncharacterized protein (TIGR02611 family)